MEDLKNFLLIHKDFLSIFISKQENCKQQHFNKEIIIFIYFIKANRFWWIKNGITSYDDIILIILFTINNDVVTDAVVQL